MQTSTKFGISVDGVNDLAHEKPPSMDGIASTAMYQPVPIGSDWFIRIEVDDDAGNSDVRYVIS